MSLHVALLALADEGLTARDRRRWEAALRDQLLPRFGEVLRRWTRASHLVDDAVAFTLERAARRGNGYLGAHGDDSAWEWTLTIAKNFIRDRLAQEARAARRDEALRARLTRELEEAREEERSFEEARDVYELLRRRAERAPSQWNEHLHLALTQRWPRLDHEPAGDGSRRAQNDLAQRRRRGRRRLGELLTMLVAEGALDAARARSFAREHRVPYPPPPRERRRHD